MIRSPGGWRNCATGRIASKGRTPVEKVGQNSESH